jgi:hypothetical protein
LRPDRWSARREATGALSRALIPHRGADALRDRVEKPFASLALIEPY